MLLLSINHRDIKSVNILILTKNGRLQPKMVDSNQKGLNQNFILISSNDQTDHTQKLIISETEVFFFC